MWLQISNKVKVTHQGEGHMMVKVKYRHLFQFYVAHTVKQAGSLRSTEMRSCCSSNFAVKICCLIVLSQMWKSFFRKSTIFENNNIPIFTYRILTGLPGTLYDK